MALPSQCESTKGPGGARGRGGCERVYGRTGKENDLLSAKAIKQNCLKIVEEKRQLKLPFASAAAAAASAAAEVAVKRCCMVFPNISVEINEVKTSNLVSYFHFQFQAHAAEATASHLFIMPTWVRFANEY